MSYDCLIIGGGLAGLTCGIACAGEGLRTVIISSGTNALHFSSGSIDLLGYTLKQNIAEKPFIAMKELIRKKPRHPYARVGVPAVRKAMEFFKGELEKEGISLNSNGERNHFHVTGIGTLKPTFYSQESVYNDRIRKAFDDKEGITVLNFEGYRDYYAEIAVEQMKKHPIMKGIKISIGEIRLPIDRRSQKSIHEFRSIDLARIFETEKYLPRIAGEIKKTAGGSKIVCVPAFMGIDNFQRVYKKLEEMTGLLIYEVTTLPPSILGMRIDNALRSRYAALGGEYSSGDRVSGGEYSKGRLEFVQTRNFGNTRHRARYYLLASGSFFSDGLKSEFDLIEEPLFNLKVRADHKRNRWYSTNFFDSQGHPFLNYGVDTNRSLNPFDRNGKVIRNFFCAGAILSGYNPIQEGSGGGVAISTGYYAAQKMISGCRKG